MAGIGSSFGSTKTFSFYDRNKAWRAKQREHTEKFQNQTATAANLFATTISSTQSATELLFQQVVQRVQEEAKVKAAEQNDAIDTALDTIDSLRGEESDEAGSVDVTV